MEPCGVGRTQRTTRGLDRGARGSNAITYARKHNRLYKTCTRVHSAQTGKAQASIHQIGTRTPSNTVRSREGHMRHAPSFTVPLATTRLATSFSSRDPASARPCPAHLPVAGCPRKKLGCHLGPAHAEGLRLQVAITSSLCAPASWLSLRNWVAILGPAQQQCCLRSSQSSRPTSSSQACCGASWSRWRSRTKSSW